MTIFDTDQLPSDEVLPERDYSAPNNEGMPAMPDDFADLTAADTSWEDAIAQGAGEEQPQPSSVAAKPSVQVVFLATELFIASGLNPRRHYDNDSMIGLSDSIKERGVLQPITVRPSLSLPGSFEIVMGERRFRASKMAELTHIPAIIDPTLTDSDVAEIGLHENLKRKELTPIEAARGAKKVLDLNPGMRQLDLAEKLSMPQSSLANLLRLLDLPAATIGMIDRGLLLQSHGVALAGIADNPEACDRIATQAQQGGWTQSRIEEEVRTFKAAQKAATRPSVPEMEGTTKPTAPAPESPRVGLRDEDVVIGDWYLLRIRDRKTPILAQVVKKIYEAAGVETKTLGAFWQLRNQEGGRETGYTADLTPTEQPIPDTSTPATSIVDETTATLGESAEAVARDLKAMESDLVGEDEDDEFLADMAAEAAQAKAEIDAPTDPDQISAITQEAQEIVHQSRKLLPPWGKTREEQVKGLVAWQRVIAIVAAEILGDQIIPDHMIAAGQAHCVDLNPTLFADPNCYENGSESLFEKARRDLAVNEHPEYVLHAVVDTLLRYEADWVARGFKKDHSLAAFLTSPVGDDEYSSADGNLYSFGFMVDAAVESGFGVKPASPVVATPLGAEASILTPGMVRVLDAINTKRNEGKPAENQFSVEDRLLLILQQAADQVDIDADEIIAAGEA